MKNLNFEKITPTTQKRILSFLNRAKEATDIAGTEPKYGPVVDHKRGPISGYDIGETVAERILDKKKELKGNKFTDITELNEIKGLGQDKLNDLAYSFDDAFEIPLRIAEELNEAGLSENLKRLYADQHRRLIKKIKSDVITLDADMDPDLAPFPGSVTIFVAEKNNRLFRELKVAFENKNESRLKELGKKLREIAQAREVASVTKAVGQLIKKDSYFDFRYNGKTLAPNIGLINDVEIASLSFAYNGGELIDEDFDIIEYCDPRNCDPSPEGYYEYLIIKRAPKLTDIEREVLKVVPTNQLELNIGAVAACPIATVVLVTVIVVVTVAGKTCGAFRDRLAEVVFPPHLVQDIGKLASARELLNMRREVFREFGM